jgi:hypothetical protein
LSSVSAGSSWKNWKDDADMLSAPARQLVLAQFVHRFSEHEDFAPRRTVDAGDHVEQRGLAAARWADDRHKLTWADLKRNMLENVNFTAADRIAFDDIAQLDSSVLSLAQKLSIKALS